MLQDCILNVQLIEFAQWPWKWPRMNLMVISTLTR